MLSLSYPIPFVKSIMIAIAIPIAIAIAIAFAIAKTTHIAIIIAICRDHIKRSINVGRKRLKVDSGRINLTEDI